MKGDYVSKSIRFHKEDDKELLEKIQEFCSKRKLSEKVKEVLKDYFNIWELNNKKILDSIEDLKSMIKSGGFVSGGNSFQQSNTTMSKTENVISIDELMKSSFDESSDEDLF